MIIKRRDHLERMVMAKPLQDLIQSLVDCAIKDFPKLLNENLVWSRPKGDLLHWINLLNRIDEILESVIKKYGLSDEYVKLQTFNQKDTDLVTSCLAFTYTLLENSKPDIDRPIYSSSERIFDLINTPTIDVRLKAMEVAVLIGERYVKTSSSKYAAPKSTKNKILSFAHSYPPVVPPNYSQKFPQNSDDKSNKIPTIIGDSYSYIDTITATKKYPSKWKSLHHSYFISSFTKIESDKKSKSKKKSEKNDEKESVKKGLLDNTGTITNEGVATFSLTEDMVRKLTYEQILDKASESVQQQQWFDISLIAANAKAFNTTSFDSMSLREKLLRIKCLSIGFITCMCNTQYVSSKLFETEPYTFSFLVDLILPENTKLIPISVFASALRALQCISLKKSWCSDIVKCMSGNVNHGLLFQCIRHIQKLVEGESVNYHENVYVYFFLILQYLIISTKSMTLRLASGGLLLELMNFLKIRSKYRRTCSAAVKLISIFLHNSPNSIEDFANNDGFSMIIDAVKHEVNFALENPNYDNGAPKDAITYYKISFRQSEYILSLVKLVSEIIESDSGDRLRNLFDSPILESFNQIILNPHIFGPEILGYTLDCVFYIIHNEPTAFAILSEAKVIDTILDNYETLFLPSGDLLKALQYILSAVCLNKKGLDMVIEKKIISIYFKSFFSIAFAKELVNTDESTGLGSSFDELGRHYPILKPIILEETKKLVELSSNFVNSNISGIQFYHSKAGSLYKSSKDEIVENELGCDEIESWETADYAYVADNIFFFLGGLLPESGQWGKDAMDKIESKWWCSLLSMKNVPYDFSQSTGVSILLAVFKYFDEENKDYGLPELAKLLKLQLNEKCIQDYINYEDANNSFFARYEDIKNDGTYFFKSLNCLQLILFALVEVYINPSQMVRERYQQVVDIFKGPNGLKILTDLGLLLQRTIIEETLIRTNTPKEVIEQTEPTYEMFVTHPIQILVSDTKERPLKTLFSSAAFKNTLQIRYINHSITSQIASILCSTGKIGMYKHQDVSHDDWRRNAIEITIETGKLLTSALKRKFLNNYYNYCYTLVMTNIIEICLLQRERHRESIQTILLISLIQNGFFEVLKSKGQFVWSELISKDPKEVELSKLLDFVSILDISILKNALSQIFLIFAKSVNSETITTIPLAKYYFYYGYGNALDFEIVSAVVIQTRLVAFELLSNTIGATEGVSIAHADNIPYPILDQIGKIAKCMVQGKQEISGSEFVPLDVLNVSPPIKVVNLLLENDFNQDQASELLKSKDVLKIKELRIPGVSLEQWSDLLNSKSSYQVEHPEFRNGEDLELLRFEERSNFVKKWTNISKIYPKSTSIIADLLTSVTLDDNMVVAGVLEIAHDLWHSLPEKSYYLTQVLELLCACLKSGGVSHKSDMCIENVIEFTYNELSTNANLHSEPYLKPLLRIYEQVLQWNALPPSFAENMHSTELNILIPYHLLIKLKESFLEKLVELPLAVDIQLFTIVARILIIYTTDYKYAIFVAKSKIMKLLLRSLRHPVDHQAIEFKMRATEFSTFKSLLTILVRRCFEDTTTLQNNMSVQISNVLSNKPKLKMKEFIADSSAIMFREPNVFLDVFSKEVRIDYFEEALEDDELSLYKFKKDKHVDEDIEMVDASDVANVDDINLQKPIESNGIIHMLLTELMETFRLDWVSSPVKKTEEKDNEKKFGDKVTRAELFENQNFAYICFLMLTVMELVGSYKQAKLDFLTFSKKRNDSKLKPRSTSLNFFIHQLIPTNLLDVNTGAEHERRSMLSSICKFTILSFISTPILDKENSPDGNKEDIDMAFIRKYLVDVILKILNETISAPVVAKSRFGKVLDIFDLVNSLLSPKFRESNFPLLNKQAVKYDQFYISRAFLDKDVPSQITKILADIDLNFPDSDKVTKAIVKPLISLSKSKLEYQSLFEDEFQGEEDDDIVPDEFEDREETPDLFRNSTLGMYDIETDSEDDEDDELEDGALGVMISDDEIVESDSGSSGLSDLESDDSDGSGLEDYYTAPGHVEHVDSEMEEDLGDEEDNDSVMMGDIEIINELDESEQSQSEVDEHATEISDYDEEDDDGFSSVYDDEELDGWIEEFEDDDSSFPAAEEMVPVETEDTPIRNRRDPAIRRVNFESNEESDENLSDVESALEVEHSYDTRNDRMTFLNDTFGGGSSRVTPSLATLLDSFLGEAGVLNTGVRFGNGQSRIDFGRNMSNPFDLISNLQQNFKHSTNADQLFVTSAYQRWVEAKKLFDAKILSNIVNKIGEAAIASIDRASLKIYDEKREQNESARREREKRLHKKEEEERNRKEEEAKEKKKLVENENLSHTDPIYVQIGDREVDISGTDIDPEFFEALPHDMREEVFTQHVTERRANATSTGADAREIDPDFLNALPDQIREEILQQESMNRRFSNSDRFADEESEDFDNEEELSSRLDVDVGPAEVKKDRKSKKVFFTPLVDRQGISSITRLLFAPLTLNQREVIYNTLNFLCHNKQSRFEIMGMLISILYDALINKRTTEKLFNQISIRALGQKDGKSKLPFGSTITIICIQVIEAVDFLLDRNAHLRYYLLTEHENPFIQKIICKNQLESSRDNKYSINYLLRILDSPLVKEEQVFMDILARVLQMATRPLQVLLKVNEQEMPSTFVSPFIPNENYCNIIKILTANECSNSTFRRAISAMQNLSVLPNVQIVFSQELSEQATALGQIIVKEITKLAQELNESFDTENKLFSKFSSPASDQAKLLRILTALDYMYESKEKEIEGDLSKDEGARDREITELTGLYSKLSLGSVWDSLSECLRVFENKAEITTLATSLLPLIEALMVVCKRSKVKDFQIKDVMKFEVKKVDFTKEPIERLFFSFTDEHKKLLNQMVRTNPNLMSGPFGMLVRNPRVLEFDNKKNYFDRKLHQETDESGKLTISIRRDQVFLDSFRALFFKSKDDFKSSKLEINFKGEAGVDAGGVTREWYQVLSRQMFNPDYALFSPVASDDTTFHPNRTSWVNPEHLSFFKFIGRIIGKAIYDNCFLDCHFSRAVYKRILSRPASLKDMETLDLEYFKSLMWMMENDITDIITEDFSVEADDYGEHKVIDLIPNGRNIPVTEENKQDYISKIVEYRLHTSVIEQMDNFLIGFHEIIPKELVSIFDEQELELLISGLPDINVEDWQLNTTYNNYSPSNDQIQWFWRAVKSFDNEERAKLLQFSTGTSKVPLNGFKELSGANGFCKFSIHRDYGSTDRLPSSHTCFNQIDLPQYESYEELRGSLLLAITEGHVGFGLA